MVMVLIQAHGARWLRTLEAIHTTQREDAAHTNSANDPQKTDQIEAKRTPDNAVSGWHLALAVAPARFCASREQCFTPESSRLAKHA